MAIQTKRVAVIGAGPGGLAAMKYLLAEGASVTLFEKKSSAGGVWHPEYESDGRVRGPMYESLETNVPHTLMTFGDFPYPANTPLYPGHRLVKQYLQSYAGSLTACAVEGTELVIKYDTSVVDVRGKLRGRAKKWQITSTNNLVRAQGSGGNVELFDNVVVAVGNYHTPIFPTEPTISPEWLGNWIIHPTHYPGPEPFAGKASPDTVVIVGNGPSGWDISSQIAAVAKTTIVSNKRIEAVSSDRIVSVGTVKAYNYATRSVSFHRGPKARQVDIIVICTGYQYDYTFLKTSSGNALIPAGTQVVDLFQHMIYKPEPSLAFLGIPKMTASFVVAEVQSAFIARVFTSNQPLPPDSAMASYVSAKSKEWSQRIEKSKLPPNQKMLHNLGQNLDRTYVHTLYEMAMELGGRKQPPRWCAKLDTARELNKAIRQEFKEAGEARFKITSFEQLGRSLPEECDATGF